MAKKYVSVWDYNVRALIRKIFIFMQVPEHFFLVFSILFGGLFVFLTPPLQVPDEQVHFIRAYQISDLDFVSQPFKYHGETRYGSPIPKSLLTADTVFRGNVAGHGETDFPKSVFKQYVRQPLNPTNTQQTVIEASAVYSPVIYVPQTLGIWTARVFKASPMVMIWLGRIMNLALWVFVMYMAIKLLPFVKWVMVLLALNPVAVFLSASLSPDVTNISFAFLFVSLIIRTFTYNGLLSKKYLAVVLGVLSVLALSKPVNLVFALLLFAIPLKRFVNKQHYLLFSVGGLVLALVLFGLWNYNVKDILTTAVSHQADHTISDSGQMSYIIHSPIAYLRTVFDNFILVEPGTYGDAVLTTFFGVFGWLDTSIPLWTMMLYLLVVFFAFLYQLGRGISPTRMQRDIFLAAFLAAFLGNITAMYFNSTPVGGNVIAGVQGRYFFASTALLLIVFSARKKILNITNRSLALVFTSAMLLILGMTTLRIFLRYYA